MANNLYEFYCNTSKALPNKYIFNVHWVGYITYEKSFENPFFSSSSHRKYVSVDELGSDNFTIIYAALKKIITHKTFDVRNK